MMFILDLVDTHTNSLQCKSKHVDTNNSEHFQRELNNLIAEGLFPVHIHFFN